MLLKRALERWWADPEGNLREGVFGETTSGASYSFVVAWGGG